ncbi:Hypothetical protein BALAC2494_01721 [Bifidobacterium animalis subsp. lactis CNCM I-2494]|uniref:Uncharacterized protein n=1 Tax=Bifidobacterium animalis subsp. lactis CNCM I-2494 TaxID=1042403 RepID=A0A806FL77_BIFAN|nr:Hypothetical protein BALAC2494_01721 [Bifidobacterium animalis subsp. lactis CNCM I-2494]
MRDDEIVVGVGVRRGAGMREPVGARNRERCIERQVHKPDERIHRLERTVRFECEEVDGEHAHHNQREHLCAERDHLLRRHPELRSRRDEEMHGGQRERVGEHEAAQQCRRLHTAQNARTATPQHDDAGDEADLVHEERPKAHGMPCRRCADEAQRSNGQSPDSCKISHVPILPAHLPSVLCTPHTPLPFCVKRDTQASDLSLFTQQEAERAERTSSPHE